MCVANGFNDCHQGLGGMEVVPVFCIALALSIIVCLSFTRYHNTHEEIITNIINSLLTYLGIHICSQIFNKRSGRYLVFQIFN